MRPINRQYSVCQGHAQYSQDTHNLAALCQSLQLSPEIQAKRAISHAAVDYTGVALEDRYAMPGDDCAAFKTEHGYQLLAMEGLLPEFVKNDPRAAGWSSVMVNISDIAAMGGRPQAIVNAYWHNDNEQACEILHHIKRACAVFGIHFAGGHSSIASHYTPHLAVGISGFAKRLLSCHHIQPKQRLFLLSDLTGSWHGDLPYWGCVNDKTSQEIRHQWSIPAILAEKNLVSAAKDISNGGILGTLIMMLELTGCGAKIDINAIAKPDDDLLKWLRAFQSFGFLLVVEPDQVSHLIRFFKQSHLSCVPIGETDDTGRIELGMAGATSCFWNIKEQPLTHMGTSLASHKNPTNTLGDHHACR